MRAPCIIIRVTAIRSRSRTAPIDLMKDSLVASRQAGLSFSVLFGIHNFYHRFGFVPAWAKHTITAKVGDLPGTPHWRARKAGKADVPKMFEHYERLYGAMDGSAVREPRLFLRRKKDAVFILQGPHKADWAYAVFRTPMGDGGGLLHLLEASGNGADWPEAVLHQAARHAGKVQQEEVTFALPAAHPVCWQMTFRNATAKIEYARNGAAMAAVLDFAGLARAMAPEWCRLASTAGTPVPREGLAIDQEAVGSSQQSHGILSEELSLVEPGFSQVSCQVPVLSQAWIAMSGQHF